MINIFSHRSHNSYCYSYWLSIGKILLWFIILFTEIYLIKFACLHQKINFQFFSTTRDFNTLKMWYNKPSTEIPLKNIESRRFKFKRTHDNLIWQQNTLPIGNSYLGANIFGEISTERVTFNEKSLWTGGPSKKRPDYNGGNIKSAGQNGKLFREIRKLFKEGENDKAAQKCQTLLGQNPNESFGSFQCFGELQFHFLRVLKEKVFDYIRYLDLNMATAHVNYKYRNEKGEVSSVEREFFASYPDNVVCMRFISTSEMTIEAKFNLSHDGKTTVDDNEITVEGELEDNQLKFNGKMVVVVKDGKVKKKANSLLIVDSTDVAFFVSAATDYNNSYPVYRTGETAEELDKRVQSVIEKAVLKGYEKVKESHLTDYCSIFDRVKIDIGQETPEIPTDELLSTYKSHFTESIQKVPNEGELAPYFRYLEVLLFQYGRYLDISSSRVGSLPPNLQGVWNDQTIDVPWASDYHININLQMNYWPTFSTNMAECGPPLLDFIESFREPGKVTSLIYTGIRDERGFMTHHRLNPFGWTAPGQKFKFGWAPTSLLWILHNVYELFLYTNNVTLLRERIYPLLRDEALYFEKLLIFDEKNNRTITSPTSSPEQGPPTNGNTFEQTNLWQHFTNTLNAAKILNVDSEHYGRWQSLIDSFKPIEIGLSGQIKEWYCEKELGSMGEPKHRHLSHLLGLFPYNLINDEHKEWLDAAVVSLNDRGDETTGWGMGQRINAWARVGDGDRAFKLIQYLLKNGIYSNLWDTHPPFQIDGNFGATSGMTEMLFQSTFNKIKILPALPNVWMKSGMFKGLVAKGNIVVSCWWKDGKAREIIIEPRFDAEIEIDCIGINNATVIEKESGKNVDFRSIKKDKIVLDVKANCLYVIKN